MKPVVIIAAVPQEIELLEMALEHFGKVKTGGFEYVEGTLGKLRVVVSAGGVGKANAAATAAVMIDRYQPQLVINTGCAGAYIGSGLAIGNYMNIPSVEQGGLDCYNLLPLSRHASEKAMQLADYYGVKLVRGRFATVSTCSGTRKYGSEIAHRWNAVIENMEGAAVAQVCLRCGVDCLEIRGISNIVDERDLLTWDIPRAVEAAQRFVLKYLEYMDRPDMMPH